MKKLVPVLSVAVALFVLGCDGGSSGGGGGGAKPTKILAMGDSIGTGAGVATPWPSFLESMMGVPVANNSVYGRYTSGGLAALPGALESAQPSHVCILLGTNDGRKGNVDGGAANLQEMINIARRFGAKVVVGTLPPIPRSSSEDAGAAALSRRIKGLSGAKIANVRSEVSTSQFVDGIHPNDGGQRNIAAAFMDKL